MYDSIWNKCRCLRHKPQRQKTCCVMSKKGALSDKHLRNFLGESGKPRSLHPAWLNCILLLRTERGSRASLTEINVAWQPKNTLPNVLQVHIRRSRCTWLIFQWFGLASMILCVCLFEASYSHVQGAGGLTTANRIGVHLLVFFEWCCHKDPKSICKVQPHVCT